MEWLSKGGLTPNDLRSWLDKVARNNANFQKDDWDLLFEFSLYRIDIYTHYLFLFSIFESISSTKIRNKRIEVPFFIPGVSTERKRHFRFKPIVDSDIGFLLEFNWYSSESVDAVQYLICPIVITSP